MCIINCAVADCRLPDGARRAGCVTGLASCWGGPNTGEGVGGDYSLPVYVPESGPARPQATTITTSFAIRAAGLAQDGSTVRLDGMEASIHWPGIANNLKLNASVDVKEGQKVVVVRHADAADHHFLAFFHVHAGVELQVVGNAGPIDRRLHAVQPHRRSVLRQAGGLNGKAGRDRCGLGSSRSRFGHVHRQRPVAPDPFASVWSAPAACQTRHAPCPPCVWQSTISRGKIYNAHSTRSRRIGHGRSRSLGVLLRRSPRS